MQADLGPSCRVSFRHVSAGLARRFPSWQVAACQSRHGSSRHCRVGLVFAVQAMRFVARLRCVELVSSRRCRRCKSSQVEAGHVVASQASLGPASRVSSLRVIAGVEIMIAPFERGQGKSSFVTARLVSAMRARHVLSSPVWEWKRVAGLVVLVTESLGKSKHVKAGKSRHRKAQQGRSMQASRGTSSHVLASRGTSRQARLVLSECVSSRHVSVVHGRQCSSGHV